jgi:hypothetical protein
MKKLSTEEIEFITKCLKENKPLSDNYRYIIPFETKKEYRQVDQKTVNFAFKIELMARSREKKYLN